MACIGNIQEAIQRNGRQQGGRGELPPAIQHGLQRGSSCSGQDSSSRCARCVPSPQLYCARQSFDRYTLRIHYYTNTLPYVSVRACSLRTYVQSAARPLREFLPYTYLSTLDSNDPLTLQPPLPLHCTVVVVCGKKSIVSYFILAVARYNIRRSIALQTILISNTQRHDSIYPLLPGIIERTLQYGTRKILVPCACIYGVYTALAQLLLPPLRCAGLARSFCFADTLYQLA